MEAIEEDIQREEDFHNGTQQDVDTLDEEEFEYESVDIPEDSDEDEEAAEENFQDVLRTVKLQQELNAPPEVQPVVTKQPEVVDDFVRNYLVKAGLEKTLDIFEAEWYEKKPEIGKAGMGLENLLVPEVYQQNASTLEELEMIKDELQKTSAQAERGRQVWDKLKKDRDNHKMSHQRVVQEKTKLVTDIKRLQSQCAKYEPTIAEIRGKYEVCMKEKMLVRLDRDKLQSRIKQLETQLKEVQSQQPSKTQLKKEAPAKKAAGDSVWPAEDRHNPFKGVALKPPNNVITWAPKQSHKGHSMSVSCIALHPKTATVATGSDDTTWKLWSAPNGELIMSGDDHKDWVASVDFHPKGTHLVTGSGDATVKVWDFLKAKCVATYKDHSQGVWRAQFNDTGDFVASCSLDHTCRVWDVNSNKCRATLRGHVDSVNGLAWLPYSNSLATCSGDKTISLWDPRTAYCTHTFYGHENACNSVAFTHSGEKMLSTDADGKVYIWDVREVRVLKVVDCGPHPANAISVDRSSTYFAVASDDCTIKLFNMEDEKEGLKQIKGHEDAVLGCAFDPNGNFLVSCGSDASWKFWG
mmetsp:Transcript_135192/g.234429  ORF Transcript_135192/g.234429 Transcript_135192/m.234429 type:complete len:580 (-) Transcript_135192:735-2474(-)